MRDSHLYIIIAFFLLVLLCMSRSEGFVAKSSDMTCPLDAYLICLEKDVINQIIILIMLVLHVISDDFVKNHLVRTDKGENRITKTLFILI